MVATPKPQLVAVDTNILLRPADNHETTIDAWQGLKFAGLLHFSAGISTFYFLQRR
jgi:hypothetical protein